MNMKEGDQILSIILFDNLSTDKNRRIDRVNELLILKDLISVKDLEDDTS